MVGPHLVVLESHRLIHREPDRKASAKALNTATLF
jgi:hypothetical protein